MHAHTHIWTPPPQPLPTRPLQPPIVHSHDCWTPPPTNNSATPPTHQSIFILKHHPAIPQAIASVNHAIKSMWLRLFSHTTWRLSTWKLHHACTCTHEYMHIWTCKQSKSCVYVSAYTSQWTNQLIYHNACTQSHTPIQAHTLIIMICCHSICIDVANWSHNKLRNAILHTLEIMRRRNNVHTQSNTQSCYQLSEYTHMCI